jgi:hypothetical protein
MTLPVVSTSPSSECLQIGHDWFLLSSSWFPTPHNPLTLNNTCSWYSGVLSSFRSPQHPSSPNVNTTVDAVSVNNTVIIKLNAPNAVFMTDTTGLRITMIYTCLVTRVAVQTATLWSASTTHCQHWQMWASEAQNCSSSRTELIYNIHTLQEHLFGKKDFRD